MPGLMKKFNQELILEII